MKFERRFVLFGRRKEERKKREEEVLFLFEEGLKFLTQNLERRKENKESVC